MRNGEFAGDFLGTREESISSCGMQPSFVSPSRPPVLPPRPPTPRQHTLSPLLFLSTPLPPKPLLSQAHQHPASASCFIDGYPKSNYKLNLRSRGLLKVRIKPSQAHVFKGHLAGSPCEGLYFVEKKELIGMEYLPFNPHTSAQSRQHSPLFPVRLLRPSPESPNKPVAELDLDPKPPPRTLPWLPCRPRTRITGKRVTQMQQQPQPPDAGWDQLKETG